MFQSPAPFRVLWIGEDQARARSAASRLESSGFHVECVQSRQAILTSFATGRWNAAIVDHEPGKTDTMEFLGEVVLRGLRLPIVLLSSEPPPDAEAWRVADIMTHAECDAGLLPHCLRYVIEHQRIKEALHHAEERLRHEALHDSLTGLPNRVKFMERLERALARRAQDPSRTMAVLFVDLDRFKVVNESLGHLVADRLLLAIARRLEACLDPPDLLARFGGDEFTIMLERLDDPSQAIQKAERIQQELARPIRLDGEEVYTTASIGIALADSEDQRATDLLRAADMAMHRAKSQGKARHELFAPGMHSQAVRLLRLETDLRRACDASEFRLHFQPIVCLESGSLRGFEALLRWEHPEHGLVPPGDFLPLAEETGLIVRIGRWVIEEACRRLAQWQRQHATLRSSYVAVNLSSREFRQPGLVALIQRVLDETGLDPSCLKIEITEGVLHGGAPSIESTLDDLKAISLGLFIDDFGTGYSSLSSLHRIPIDTLKIDRSFVHRMASEAGGMDMVQTILALAQRLDMDVVAEGVETEEQYRLLVELGCASAQGWLFSRPLRTADVESRLAAHGFTWEPARRAA